MVFESLLNPVLSPLLSLPPLAAILIVSIFLSVLMTLIYKWMTDQELMKTLKEDVNKRAMEKNMKYMMHSLKPTLVTFIPLIIIFAWLSSHLAFYPLIAGEQFTLDAEFK